MKDLLDAIGPNAALIFAAWIFLSVLQTRYTDAYGRYRELIADYRSSDMQGKLRENRREQILQYKERCEEMRRATNIGTMSAMMLIAGLIVAGVNVIVGDVALLKAAAAALLICGLACVMWAAGYMLRENRELQRAIDGEPADIEELAKLMQPTERGGAGTRRGT